MAISQRYEQNVQHQVPRALHCMISSHNLFRLGYFGGYISSDKVTSMFEM